MRSEEEQAKHIIEVAIEHLEEATPRLACDHTLECPHCDVVEVILGLVRARNLLGAALGREAGGEEV